MTNVLLTIIILLLVAKVLVEAWRGKATLEKAYTKAYEVENCVRVVNRSLYHIRETIDIMAADGWELVSAHLSKNHNEVLFFTRKKIKSFMEE